MLISKLLQKYGYNKPIFIEDIFACLKEYSRQRIYQLIEEAISCGKLSRYDRGIYYLPTVTEFGPSTLSFDEVICRKFIKDGEEVFGVYGKYVMDLNFLLSTQVPNTIEIITNKESRDIRQVEIRGRKVILRKSRFPINKENEKVYILMEFFNSIDLNEFSKNNLSRKSISDYIISNNIDSNKIYSLANMFPAKTMKNLAISGVLYEITQQQRII